ncbi:(2Fe-2S)-binding protein [Ensifer sp. T173]|uniref:(2Fe-2S)-binding protein n=1 Tax=Ensifer canadensis TaxID=555315 RepID=A0AAW4FNE4_9HYPH|nr:MULTISPECIES: (2Fe-2S)-binding protein [Ensifer]KQU90384.1 ferredoxin [Ensifer sp. Root31]KQW67143.1 ferredoxin [Ensifer sp. Root127]MBM3092953.1 (2Fe-2S)-binding protein [Ensifer canadensis]NOV16476.1 (2Fe-2S)-binding protein [Ensifer canadensis]UBI80399.1 (2Fe-2S)-binding protein [Ensifer canadensis]
MSRQALFKRRYRRDEEAIPFLLNGLPEIGRRGDTVMTAILSLGSSLRRTEFTGENRAGFCLIGACQDCFVMTADGSRVRACSTALKPGMAFFTTTMERVEHD